MRELAAGAKVKILHVGREGVERVVPVVGKRRKKVSPDVTQEEHRGAQ
jgi:hypothetical protein